MGESVAQFTVPMAEEIDEHNESRMLRLVQRNWVHPRLTRAVECLATER